jgi:hypothetical protein
MTCTGMSFYFSMQKTLIFIRRSHSHTRMHNKQHYAHGFPERRLESVIGGIGTLGTRGDSSDSVEVTGLGVAGLILEAIHLHSERALLVRCLMFLREVELALLLEARASMVVVYYCSTYYKAVRLGAGGWWRTSAIIFALL